MTSLNQARAQVWLNLPFFLLHSEVPFFVAVFSFFFNKSMLLVTFYICLPVLQIFSQWEVLKRACD